MTPASGSTQLPKPDSATTAARSPWSWVPSLYLAEGLPYVVVMTVSVIMYKGLGISNTDIALYTSWLYLPWVIKPLWSPVVDILKTRRLWIWVMQLLIGAGLAGVALGLPGPHFFQYSLAFMWLLAFSSATHDIAADGFYLLATTQQEQAFFVGIRSTFYRISMISGQGLLVILAGIIQNNTGLPKIELSVSSKPGISMDQTIQPLTPISSPAENLKVIVQSTSVQISPEARPKADIALIIATVKERNSTNGFYQLTALEHTEDSSFWSRFVVQPIKSGLSFIGRILSAPFRCLGKALEGPLRTMLGPQTKAQSDVAGNVGLTFIHLSKPPGKSIVINIAQKPGGLFGFFKTASKSVSAIEGARLVFDDRNWNQPAGVLFQLDPKLRTALSATYEIRSGDVAFSWSITFGVLFLLFLFFGIYHRFILPRPASDVPGTARSLVAFLKEFLRTFSAFFNRDRIGTLLLFLLFYRFGEAQLVKMVAPFLLDAREQGGLGLTTGQVGFVYGTVGIIALTCGGLLGGMLASKQGLKFWLWPMICIMHIPDAVFVYLAYAQPDSFAAINLCVALEQFGYGFGFTAYMLYMIYIARGRHETAHYAICTGFMAMGMMLPGMFSGWLQELIGYQHFFVWVLLATVPSFLIVAFLPLDAGFGKKSTAT